MIIIQGSKWDRLKAEYISGNISYRKLAKKYNVPFATLSAHASREKWAEARQEAKDKASAYVIQKTADTISECAEIAEELKLKLLLRLKRIEEKYPFDATEIRSKVNGHVAIFRIRDLTAAYKDIIENMPREEDSSTLEKLDAMLAEVRNHAVNS